MKMRRMLLTVAALLVAQLSLGDVAFSNHSLGMMESTLAFCAESDSAGAAKYEERAALMVRRIPAKELAEARDTEEYKQAYASIADTLAGVAKEQLKKTCKELLSRNESFIKASK